jgi:hypothetical protein
MREKKKKTYAYAKEYRSRYTGKLVKFPQEG